MHESQKLYAFPRPPRKEIWHNFSPLPQLSRHFALVPCFKLDTEVAGGRDRDDFHVSCFQDDCGTLMMSWFLPLVSTCLRRLRLGSWTAPPTAWDCTSTAGPQEWRKPLVQEGWFWPLVGDSCWPLSAPNVWGTLEGDTMRLQPFPFMSSTARLIKITSLPWADHMKRMHAFHKLQSLVMQNIISLLWFRQFIYL